MKLLSSVLIAMLCFGPASMPSPNRDTKQFQVDLASTQEHRMEDGRLFTPTSQSFLRERHWLERVQKAKIKLDGDDRAQVELVHPDSEHYFRINHLPMKQLVPRLHYQIGSDPDDFDAFNLMLAEYSRNSITIPVGRPGDTMTHFQTNLVRGAPWSLTGDYEFRPNPYISPLRVGIVNNCLRPGLWEISATDRSAEIYHGWFEIPLGVYHRLVAETNGLPLEFVTEATTWHTRNVDLDLNRLRDLNKTYGSVSALFFAEGSSGFSTQDSRRKLAKGFVLVNRQGTWQKPNRLGELTEGNCKMSEFIEPGLYGYNHYREFDLGFLRDIVDAQISRTRPLTRYEAGTQPGAALKSDYLEIRLNLEQFSIIIGNLPLNLLVSQEDFVIHGFGVGVLSSSEYVERRAYLLKEGPAPSFVYLTKEEGGVLKAVNSHEYGLEQVFIRTDLSGDQPVWEITLASYERIVDIVKYRVQIPRELHRAVRKATAQYISPIYFTYRDDNLR